MAQANAGTDSGRGGGASTKAGPSSASLLAPKPFAAVDPTDQVRAMRSVWRGCDAGCAHAMVELLFCVTSGVGEAVRIIGTTSTRKPDECGSGGACVCVESS